MKLIKLITLWVLSLVQATLLGQSNFFEEADAFFKQHVVEGRIDYSSIYEAPQELNNLITSIHSYSIRLDQKNESLAFYINTYNLLVIKNIIDHYPINSPMDIPGFFDEKSFLIANKALSLNNIENDIIRPIFKDPRIHFALVCGAVSCPPIIPNAYFPDNVQEQLTMQTTTALNNTSFTILDTSSLSLSQIFNWYSIDFTTDSTNLIEFINLYRTITIPLNTRISFYPYDWQLNKQ